MEHPARSDFDILVTETGVRVTFKRTNSVYRFHRLTNTDNIARFGAVSFAGVQHAGRNTGDYSSDEVQDMAQRIASEFARSFRSVLDEALAGIRTTDNIAPLRPAPPADTRHAGPSGNTKAQRVASEVAETLWLIQNLDKAD